MKKVLVIAENLGAARGDVIDGRSVVRLGLDGNLGVNPAVLAKRIIDPSQPLPEAAVDVLIAALDERLNVSWPYRWTTIGPRGQAEWAKSKARQDAFNLKRRREIAAEIFQAGWAALMEGE